jgi:RNA-directed DNA polymerase
MNRKTSSAAAQWVTTDWRAAYKRINKLQTRITKATMRGNRNLVKKLQYLLTNSFYAKLLAVKQVTSNKGKSTPGIDNQLWRTPSGKLKAVLSLDPNGYKAKPLKRIYIEKKGKKKKRPLGIPTMHDRAIQALFAMALDDQRQLFFPPDDNFNCRQPGKIIVADQLDPIAEATCPFGTCA